MNILKILRSALISEEKETEINHSRDRIASQDIANQFTSNPDFPYLVSFSRTGSHWLRMLMELYLDKPGLKLLFFRTVEETGDYSCLHTHDLELKVEARNVIYLYRDPVDTIYSQMSFHAQDMSDKQLRNGWTELYSNHLYKWLVAEKFTVKKTVLRYESMRADLNAELAKVSAFFGVEFDAKRAEDAAAKVSKDAIREKTKHDPRVINVSKGYESSREDFRKLYGKEIYDLAFSLHPELKSFFQ